MLLLLSVFSCSPAFPADSAMSPKISVELLRQLRQAMKSCRFFPEPLQAYIIPSGDAHQVGDRLIRGHQSDHGRSELFSLFMTPNCTITLLLRLRLL